MRFPSIVRWTLLALLGLAVAAAVSVAASHLVSKRIGLASEPLSAGKELAPPNGSENGGGAPGRRHESDGNTSTPVPAPAPPTTTAVPAAPAPPAPPVGGPTTSAPPASPSDSGERETGGSAGDD
jgi:hypothetical protein